MKRLNYKMMDIQALPLVPFGKYKDKSVTELLADKNYVDWLKKQSWFSENSPIYNIVVNQTINTTNNSKTPEHNKLQNLFLDKNNQKKILSKLFNKKINSYIDKVNTILQDKEIIRCFGENNIPEFSVNLHNTTVKFEYKFNWDLYIHYYDIQEIILTSNLETEQIDKIKYKEQYDIKEKYKNDYAENYENNFNKHYEKYRLKYYEDILKYYEDILNHDTFLYVRKSNENQYDLIINICNIDNSVYCELKPSLSDDYPCVLRKLQTQIKLTNNEYGRKYNFGLASDRRKLSLILLIESFTSKYTSKEQLIEIFKQHNIKVIFTNELFETSNSLEIESVDTNKLIEKNKFLTDNLLRTQKELLSAQEKIKYLEQEIQSLKS